MEHVTIRNVAELDDTFLDQVVVLFVEGFLKSMGNTLQLDVQKIAKGIKHSFIKKQYYAAIEGEEVLGILAVSTKQSRSHAFDRSILQREFGYFKGLMLHYFLKKELQQPIDLQDDQCYIESVTTVEKARGRGIATKLTIYLFENLDYKDFVLEVVDTNKNAIRLYERLGFTLFKRKKAGYFERRTGFTERLYMKRPAGVAGPGREVNPITF